VPCLETLPLKIPSQNILDYRFPIGELNKQPQGRRFACGNFSLPQGRAGGKGEQPNVINANLLP